MSSDDEVGLDAMMDSISEDANIEYMKRFRSTSNGVTGWRVCIRYPNWDEGWTRVREGVGPTRMDAIIVACKKAKESKNE